jgi:alpha-tubulin suppressor-like RCC1 family protein
LNSSGQLGDGTLLDKSIPIVVDPNTTYTKISLSYDYICGITSAGNLKCWGSNSLSKIGDGTTTNVINPKLIDEGVTYQKIITGNLSTYGITSDGVLKGWGYQHSGLGTGDNGSKLPTVIDAGVKYSQVITSFNSNHSCAITNSGVLKCWGRNDYGQLGTGNTVSQNKPQVIDSGVNYLKVFIRGDLTCGITTDNSLKCWGRNDNGELGDGGDPSFMMRPLNIMKWVSDLIL